MSIDHVSFGMHAINNSWSSGSPAHSGITNAALFQRAADGGAKSVRVPLDLSNVGPNGPPQRTVDLIGTILQEAAARGLKVILEPGQTPPDLRPSGAPLTQAPATDAQLAEMGARFGKLVQAVHTQYAQYQGVIEAWEVGNEPNLSFENDGVTHGGSGDPSAPRFYVVGLDNAEAYAKFLHSANAAVQQIEASLGQDIKIIAGGVAHNDYAYMERLLSKLSDLGGSIDAFSIHPYTTYDYNLQTPFSGRPTDWVPTPKTATEKWAFYHSFQGAIYGMQGLLNKYGFGGSEIWLTEFGVPSYLGYRNAGPAGEIDQANFYAEAFGVLDSWGNDRLAGLIAHSVLDTLYAEKNNAFNALDGNPNNDGSSAIAEGSFGLYERSTNGTISAKPAVAVIEAIVGGQAFLSSSLRIINQVSTDSIDVSQQGTNGVGFANGYIILTHNGADTIIGSAYDDSLFAGDGDDAVTGGNGADRIYGGRGRDIIDAGNGNDDVYGNGGDDRINAGQGVNRVDGGQGWDTLVLNGVAADYTITGDGRSFTAIARNGSQSTTAIHVEKIYFTVSQIEASLSNADATSGNGLGTGANAITDDALHVRVSGEDAGLSASPGITILVDSKVVGSYAVTADHSNGEWQDITIDGSWSTTKDYKIEIKYYDSRSAQSVYIDSVSMHGDTNATGVAMIGLSYKHYYLGDVL